MYVYKYIYIYIDYILDVHNQPENTSVSLHFDCSFRARQLESKRNSTVQPWAPMTIPIPLFQQLLNGPYVEIPFEIHGFLGGHLEGFSHCLPSRTRAYRLLALVPMCRWVVVRFPFYWKGTFQLDMCYVCWVNLGWVSYLNCNLPDSNWNLNFFHTQNQLLFSFFTRYPLVN